MFIIKSVTLLLLLTIYSLVVHVENKAIFAIGNRIQGDQLMVKDVLEAPPTSWSDVLRIRFNYAVPEPITYIEILSDENIYAEVDFSYKDELILGAITAINRTSDNEAIDMASNVFTELSKFEVLITIYGFNETQLDLNTAYTLNRDQDFTGILRPEASDEDYYSDGDDDKINETQTTEKMFEEARAAEDNDENNDSRDDDYDDDEENDTDDSDDFERENDIIELGYRQKGDYRIYETFQTSTVTTKEAENHSVIFYYVDNNFITYAKFIAFNDDENSSSADQQTSLVAEYSQFSPTTLKAIITDPQTTSLFVQMCLYGYKPEDLPVGYVNYWDISEQIIDGITTNTPLPSGVTSMTTLQRIKMLINSRQRDDNYDDDNNRSKVNQPIIITKYNSNGDVNADDDDDDNDDNGNDNHEKSKSPKKNQDENDKDNEYNKNTLSSLGNTSGNNNNNKFHPVCIDAAVTISTNFLSTKLIPIFIITMSLSIY